MPDTERYSAVLRRHVTWLHWTLPECWEMSSRSTKDLFQEGGQGSHRFFERRRNFVTSTRLHQGPKTLSPYSPEPAAWPHTACGRGPGLGMQAPITNPALPFCPPSFCSTECPSPAYQNFLGPGSKKISRWNTPVCGFL